MTLVPATLASVLALFGVTVGVPPSESAAAIGVKLESVGELTPAESRSTVTMLTLTPSCKYYQELRLALFVIRLNCDDSLVVCFSVMAMEEVMMVGVDVVVEVGVMLVIVMEECGIWLPFRRISQKCKPRM